jgi:hypothetical protein
MAELVNLSEEEKLKRHLKTSHTERYHLLMKLFRLGKKMQRATILTQEKDGRSG